MGHNNHNMVYLRTLTFEIVGEGISGDFDFPLNLFGPRNNMVEYFYFVDSNGDLVVPTAGTVNITMSSGSPIFHTLCEGSFNAIDSTLSSRAKPNGYGSADYVRFSLAGVTGIDIVGFKSYITQSVR